MQLIQILLPIRDNLGRPIDRSQFQDLRQRLIERYGGLTAYVRSPAEGLWKDEKDKTIHDEVVLLEVMVEVVDRAWWHGFREEITARFGQQDLVIRAQPMELL